MRKIVAATEENKEEILKLYKIQLGREFCPWDDFYPGMKEIEFDLGRESLFVMIDGQELNADAGSKEDRIIAAISIDDDPQVEKLDCWSSRLAPGAELSRLAVHPDFQNQKIA
ncbi:MAG: GNAT family N-acetyltransferase, partial [Lachnospiraceae bacterium]|nr:GNAT family N-acetyltransferase [Lachnospiraceae bacterium]